MTKLSGLFNLREIENRKKPMSYTLQGLFGWDESYSWPINQVDRTLNIIEKEEEGFIYGRLKANGCLLKY